MSENLERVEQKEQKNIELKRASELSAEDKAKLKTVRIRIDKKMQPKTKTFFYQVKFAMDSTKEEYKDKLVFPYIPNKKRRFDDRDWNIFLLDNNISDNQTTVYKRVPIRLFTGTYEGRKYSRYQIFASDSLVLSGFFDYRDIVLLEKIPNDYAFIEVQNLGFDDEDLEDLQFN